MHIHADHYAAFGVFPRDYRRAVDDLDIRYRAQRHQNAATRHLPIGPGISWWTQQKVADRLHVVAEVLGEAQAKHKAPLPLENLGYRLAADCRFDQLVYIGNIETVTGNRTAVDVYR